MPFCERCFRLDDPLIPHKFVDDETGEERTAYLCGRCDWDLMNGRGSMSDEAGEVQDEHDEEDYEYDPVYYPPPRWMLEKEKEKP